MKKICFLLLMFISISAISQPSIKIFAYSQEVTPGIIPKNTTDENGNRVNTKKESSVNYYFFAVYNKSAKISFTELWINNKFYKSQIKKIDTTPVINTSENIPGTPVKKILVPATSLKVMSIMSGEIMNNRLMNTAWFHNMAKHAELIISYMYNGKKYFIAVKKIKVLEPIAGV